MNPFNTVEAMRPGKSAFNLSHEYKCTGDMGYLYPVLALDCMPGDVFDISISVLLRFQPLVYALMHNVSIFVHVFFAAYRNLWDDWTDFITGGEDGTEEPTFPAWDPTLNSANSMWDYLGHPPDVDPGAGTRPSILPLYAYNNIWNEWYRAALIQDEYALTNEYVKRRNWKKDYFTTALLDQQLGDPIALPLSGTLDIDSTGDEILVSTLQDTDEKLAAPSTDSYRVKLPTASGASGNLFFGSVTGLEVDLSNGTTVDVADLRLATAIQRFLERNARGGVRLTEFLQMHYGASPRDDRLDRPEYIGGMRQDILTSAVMQTSQTDTTPQGTIAGSGISVGTGYIGKYRVEEHGVLMALMSVMPEPAYQQGINRQWIKETKYDFPFPEFASLSEQPIYNAELYAQDGDTTNNPAVFGYTGRYNEYRYHPSKVVAGMRDDFDFAHLGRQFSSLPTLGNTFLLCNPDKNRIFAAQDEHSFIATIGNNIKAVRPLPVLATPGGL